MNEHTRPDLIRHLLTAATSAGRVHSFDHWKLQNAALYPQWTHPIDRAIAGGFASADAGFAFAFGYQAALQALAPAHVDARPAAFCVSESGGNSPSAIQTTLHRITPQRALLNGTKSFVTNADQAELLLLAASCGQDEPGPDGKSRNRLALALVPAQQTGVSIKLLPPLPFAPSIHHGSAHFDQVPVSAAQWLPGDGYADYVKPFRTVEDIHVSGAMLGFLLRNAREFGWPESSIEALLVQIVLHQNLAARSASDSATHILLAGARRQLEHWLQENSARWSLCPDDVAQAWQRDSALLNVAGKARAQRTATAWKNVQSGTR